MADNQTDQAQYQLPEGTGNNPQEDYNENWELANRFGMGMTVEIQTGHGGLEGEWYTLDNTGKAIKADASDSTKCRIVFMLVEDTAAGLQGRFIKGGNWKKTSWGLVVNSHYWLSQTTPGAWTTTRPATGNIIRLGRAQEGGETFHIQVSSEVEVIASGGGLPHVTVGPDPTDDYPLASAATAGENPGTIIGVKQGAYVETANIQLKEGQSLVALGGTHNDGTPGPGDDPSVTILMGDYRLIVPDADFKIEGILFDFTPATDNVKIDIDGANGIMRDVWFDLAGGALHTGVDIGAASHYSRYERIRVICDTTTRDPFENNGNENTIVDLRVTGGYYDATNAVKIIGDKNMVSDVNVSGITAVAGQCMCLLVEGDQNVIHGIHLDRGSLAMNGLLVGGTMNVVSGGSIIGSGSAYRAVSLFGSKNTIRAINILGGSVGFDVWGSNVGCEITGCTIDGVATGIDSAGSVRLKVIGNHFINNTNTYDIDQVSTDIGWIIIGNTFDMDVRLQGDYSIFDGNIRDSASGNLVITATANQNYIGTNYGFQYGTSDLGTNTQFGCRIHRAILDPTVNDDENDGYENGMFWLNTATPELFYLSDGTAGAAVWNSLAGGGDNAIKYYTVTTPTELQNALDDLRLSSVVAKGIITLGANISTSGTYNPGGPLNKDLVIRCLTGSRYYWEIANGFSISFDEDGCKCEVWNVEIRTTGTTAMFTSSGSGSGEPEMSLEVDYHNCLFTSLTATAGAMVKQNYYGNLRVSLNQCDWDNSSSDSGAVGTYLVGSSLNDSALYLPHGIEVYIRSSRTEGPLIARNNANNSVYVHVMQSTIEDPDTDGVWYNPNTLGGSAASPNGAFLVHYDSASIFSRNLVSGTALPVDFRVIGNAYTEIIVDKDWGGLDVPGRIYTAVEDAVDWTQANPSQAPFLIKIGPGEFLIERSFILDTVAVSFEGCGKGVTTLKFDRSNESASNYWIRTGTSGDPEYAPRIAFAMCGYTDQTTYGLLASSVTWEGVWHIRNMTIALQYAGNRTDASAIIPVYHRPAGLNSSRWDISDVEFKSINSPVRKVNSTPDFPAIHHDVEGSPTWGTNTANPTGKIAIERCDFRGSQLMTGTVSITSGTNGLSGSGTAFQTELFVGGLIQIEQRTYEIASITDDTTATIVGTADQTATSEPAVAIHPWSQAININTHELTADPLVTVRDCSFEWVLDRILYSYSNRTEIANIKSYNCTMHDVNHGTPAVSQSMFVNFDYATYSGIEVEHYGYLAKVFTDDLWGIFGCFGSSKTKFINCRAINGSNTYRYRTGLWATDQTIKAVNCEFGGTYDGRLYGAYLDGSYGERSVFDNCVFGAGTPNYSLYLTGTGRTECAFSNCHFDEQVYVGSIQQKAKFTACVIDDNMTILGDDFVIEGCQITESGKTLLINGAADGRVVNNWINGFVQFSGSPTNLLLEGNYIYNAVYGQIGAGSRIIGNRVEGHVTGGALALNDDVVMANNIWEWRHGNYLDTTGGVNRAVIEGNVFKQAGSSTAAVLFQLSTSLSDYISFANNVIYLDNTLTNFSVIVTDGNISITGNKFYGCAQASGYYIIDTTSYYCAISDNFFRVESFGGEVIAAGSNGWNTIHGNIIEVVSVSGSPQLINNDGDHCTIMGNSIIWTSGTPTGIDNSGDYVTIIGNSIYRGSTPSGTGINDTGANTQVANNAVN